MKLNTFSQRLRKVIPKIHGNTCGFPMGFHGFPFPFHQLRTSQELHLGDLRGVEGLHAPREAHESFVVNSMVGGYSGDIQ